MPNNEDEVVLVLKIGILIGEITALREQLKKRDEEMLQRMELMKKGIEELVREQKGKKWKITLNFS